MSGLVDTVSSYQGAEFPHEAAKAGKGEDVADENNTPDESNAELQPVTLDPRRFLR